LYEPTVVDEEAATWGFKASDFEEQFGVFTDCWLAARTFAQMGTQWRVGMNGPTGLDFNVLYKRMDRMGLTPEEYDQLESDVSVMESAALDTMQKRHKK
jgi:hypothetical protein